MGSACSVWTTLGLLLLTACVLSRSTLLRFQVVLQGNCLRRVLGCMHFPGLRHSGSWVLHKGTDGVGCVFCVLPRSEQLWQLGAWWAHCPRWSVHLNHLPNPDTWFPGFVTRELSQICHLSPLGSWSQDETILGPRLQQPYAFQLWLLHTCLSALRLGGGAYRQPLVFAQSFVLWARVPGVTVLH